MDRRLPTGSHETPRRSVVLAPRGASSQCPVTRLIRTERTLPHAFCHCYSFAYSDLAAMLMGILGSASLRINLYPRSNCSRARSASAPIHNDRGVVGLARLDEGFGEGDRVGRFASW